MTDTLKPHRESADRKSRELVNSLIQGRVVK